MADVSEDDDQIHGTVWTEVGADGTIVVRLVGDFDVSNASTIDSVLNEIDERTGTTFDVRGLRFIDSSGLAALLRFVARRGPVEMHHAPPMLRRIVEVSGLDAQLRITET